jgi:mRNA interferase RelE/StbE
VTFEIILAPAAATALKDLSVPVRAGVRKALDVHLTHDPTKVSKSRIKRLRV